MFGRRLTMKKSALNIWCDRLWLYFIYLSGIVMLNILIVGWNDMLTAQKITCMLAILIPVHVFEENTFPGGFFYQNNLGIGSKDPMVYPQNRLTNMITNMGAEITFIVLMILTPTIPYAAVTVAIAFGILETFNHSRQGVMMYRRYHDRGKATLYAPGAMSCWLGLLELSVYGWSWIASQPAMVSDILSGIGITIGIAVCFIMIPLAINTHIKSANFAFTRKGYYEKYN